MVQKNGIKKNYQLECHVVAPILNWIYKYKYKYKFQIKKFLFIILGYDQEIP